ncbi:hypothetical protein CANARDRAFT_26678 [[Candida] arabinofermentans NRRL YB-2248]|uniref:C2H2-type domain-containing protein n=1 Tax=[Candida] arabinofermentans NRRL YB-2248 TaxID=983967 RepID=A0A1E4T683_9ASCO|nr:hypothetical protein CANARDRAFT_26678 [[Candida] arabinofermentans NRRL YB-2248]
MSSNKQGKRSSKSKSSQNQSEDQKIDPNQVQNQMYLPPPSAAGQQGQLQQGQQGQQQPQGGQQQQSQQQNSLTGLPNAAGNNQYFPMQQVPQQYSNNFLPPPNPMSMQQPYYIPYFPNPYYNGSPQQQQLSQQRFSAPNQGNGNGNTSHANSNNSSNNAAQAAAAAAAAAAATAAVANGANIKLPILQPTNSFYKHQQGQPGPNQHQQPSQGDFAALQNMPQNGNFMDAASGGSSKSPGPVSFESGMQVLKPNPYHGGAVASNYRRAIQPSDPENDSKPYRCSHCDWAFVRHSDLRRHSRSHGNPEYHCPYWHPEYATCPHRNQGSFNRLDVLKRHLRLVHFDPEAQEDSADSLVRRQDAGTCLSCSKYFVNSKSFIDHVDDCALHTPMEQWRYKKNGIVTNVKKEGSDEFSTVEEGMDVSGSTFQGMEIKKESRKTLLESEDKLKRSATSAGLGDASSNTSVSSNNADGGDSNVPYLKRPRGRPRKYVTGGMN